MQVSSWIVLWKLLFIVAVALFAALAVVVTIGGYRDIRRLIRQLKSDEAERSSAEGLDRT